MPRYIEADKLIEEMKKEDALVEYDEIEEYAEENTEDVAPVIHAKWIYDEDCVICSHCGKAFSLSSNYCPNCGAEMEISNSDDDCYTDEVGGHHDCGIGWNPNGYCCGECTKSSCKDCINIDKIFDFIVRQELSEFTLVESKVTRTMKQEAHWL